MEENSIQNTNVGTPTSSSKFQISKLPAIPVIAGVVVLLVLIIAVIFFLRPKSVNNATAIKQASTQMATGNYQEAKDLYKSVLKDDKENLVALNGVINANSLEGNQNGNESKSLSESQPYIDTALNLYSNEALTLQTVGYAYETAGDYKKALELYDKAIEIDPKSSDAWFHKGHVLAFLNNNDEAKIAYDTSYKLNPNNSLVLLALGNKFASEGNLGDAYQSFIKASSNSALSPSVRAEALTAASITRRNQSNGSSNSQLMKEALTLSKQAVDVEPTFSPALGAYGINLFLTGQREKGKEYLEKAIKENPRIARNYFMLAHVLRVDKKYTESISLINEALSKIEDDNTLVGKSNKSLERGWYLYELAKTYSVGGISADILPMLQESVKLNPKIINGIKSDYYVRDGFKELEGNQAFMDIINN